MMSKHVAAVALGAAAALAVTGVQLASSNAVPAADRAERTDARSAVSERSVTAAARPGAEVMVEQPFVCGLGAQASWSAYQYDPATIAYNATSFCGGPDTSALESSTVQAFLHNADTDVIEAEGPLVAQPGDVATGIISNGGLGGVVKPSSHYVRVDTVTTLRPESGLVWESAFEGCTGVGTITLTCTWNAPDFYL